MICLVCVLDYYRSVCNKTRIFFESRIFFVKNVPVFPKLPGLILWVRKIKARFSLNLRYCLDNIENITDKNSWTRKNEELKYRDVVLFVKIDHGLER